MSLASRLPYDHAYAGGYPGIGSQPLPNDADALDYLSRMATADGAGVETGVAVAVDAFFRDAKELGVFSSIRASCLLAGARTLAGALVPLRDYGPELVDINSLPTPSVNNFGGSCGTYVDGVMLNECVGADAFQPRFSFDFGLVAGKQYAVEGRLAGDISEVSVRLGTTGTTLSYSASTGIISGTATTNTNHFVVVFNGTLAPTSVTIESLSIREVIAAPTNVADGFVEGDFSRTSGLTGDGTSYIDSGRANDDDPQNDKHVSVYASNAGTLYKIYIGSLSSTPSQTLTQLSRLDATRANGVINGATAQTLSVLPDGFFGITRSSASSQNARIDGVTTEGLIASNGNNSLNLFAFARNTNGTASEFIDATLAFYSIGTSLSLEDLDIAVTNLINRLKFALLVGENPAPYDIDTVAYVVRGYENGGTLQ